MYMHFTCEIILQDVRLVGFQNVRHLDREFFSLEDENAEKKLLEEKAEEILRIVSHSDKTIRDSRRLDLLEYCNAQKSDLHSPQSIQLNLAK